MGWILPPFDEGLDQRSIALGSGEVEQRHSSESLRMDQVFGLCPASTTHHLLAHHHHAALKAASQCPSPRNALKHHRHSSLTTEGSNNVP